MTISIFLVPFVFNAAIIMALPVGKGATPTASYATRAIWLIVILLLMIGMFFLGAHNAKRMGFVQAYTGRVGKFFNKLLFGNNVNKDGSLTLDKAFYVRRSIVLLFCFSYITTVCTFGIFFYDTSRPIDSGIIIYIAAYLLIPIVGIILLMNMKKRTPYGNEMLGKINGFRRFLELAEKPKLETLLKEDPKYFYKVLPYTYVLGVSNVWINDVEQS